MLKSSISFHPAEVFIPPTYMGISNKTVFTISNTSDRLISFEFRKYSSSEEEVEVMMKYDIDDPVKRQEYAKSLLFESPDFSFEPSNGDLWPNHSQQILATFHPTTYGDIHSTVYVTDVQTNERTEIPVFGRCLPPSAKLNFSIINIGHVIMDSINEYQIEMTNTGEAPVEFSLIENNVKPTIRFSPEQGKIDIGGFVPILVSIVGDKVGQFSHDFKFKINGTKEEDYPEVNIYGRVLGPTFNINKRSIDFGNISCGFLYTESFKIQNTSDIPLEFTSKIVSDDEFKAHEFHISPDCGVVQPRSYLSVNIEFIPSQVKKYMVTAVFDGVNQSSSLFSINVTGRSNVPTITLDNDVADLGMIYVNYPTKCSAVLVNKCKIPGKYDILDGYSDEIDFVVDMPKETGVVPELSKFEVPFVIIAHHLGPATFTKLIRIYGSDQPPLPVTFKYTCIGPVIETSESEVKFGRISVLDVHEHIITIYNRSLIPCTYSWKLESYEDVFSIENNEGVVEPNSSKDIKICASLDSSTLFVTNIIATYSYLTLSKIKLSAMGIGNCFTSSIDMQTINIGSVFAGQTTTYKFTISNNGRKANEIRWTIGNIPDKLSQKLSATISPLYAEIDGHSSQEFAIELFCSIPCHVSFTANCSIQSGNSKHPLFNSEVDCIFIPILIDIKDKSMDFNYFHNSSLEEEYSKDNNSSAPSSKLLGIIERENIITNISKLPLLMTLSVAEPFSVSDEKIELMPGEEYPFKVFFDTSFKKDFSSEIVDRKLLMFFEGNKQKFSVFLHGVLNFPNLKLSKNSVNFGPVLFSSENVRDLLLSNACGMPVKYEWKMYNNSDNKEVNSFDIFPTRGIINPGEREDAHVVFYGLENKENKGEKFSTQAVCHVYGGPDYALQLSGRTSFIKYDVEPKFIDMGIVKYTKFIEAQTFISNGGESDVHFKVLIPQKKEFEEIVVLPMSGILKPNEKVAINITLWPGVPRNLKDHIIIKTEYFDDILVELRADARYNRLSFSDNFTKKINSEEERKLCIKQSIKQLKCNYGNRHAYYVSRSKEQSYISRVVQNDPLSTFGIDFGKIVLGNVIEKEFVITNDSPFPTNFEINQKDISGTGFSINPSSCAGLPPGESIPIKITFNPKDIVELKSGELAYSVNVIVTNDINYCLTIKAIMNSPFLGITSKAVEFPTTIVGKNMTITIQVQNLNDVETNFKINQDEIIATPCVTRKRAKEIFTFLPSKGCIPPKSFQNIDINFCPKAAKEYHSAFRFVTQYSYDDQIINLSGNGSLLKMIMFPPEANFEQIYPFSDHSSMQILFSNLSKLPIEVFSRQFDTTIIKDKMERMLATSPLTVNNQEETEKNINNDLISYTETKTKICIIINGPPKCGSSQISAMLSKEYGNIPVLELSKIWGALNNEATFDEMKDAFSEAIKDTDSFILDDLSCFSDDNLEMVNFITHTQKQRGLHEELAKNIFTIVRHPDLHIETEIKAILASLEGWNVFLIGLLIGKEELAVRQEKIRKIEEDAAKEKALEKIKEISKISDEEYANLSIEEQESIDTIRKEYRDSLLGVNKSTIKQSKSFKENKAKKTVKKPKSTNIDINNIETIKFYKFYYTFGIIANEIMNSANGSLASDLSLFCKSNDVSYNKNVLTLNANKSIQQMFNDIITCIPSLEIIKQTVFTNFIPPPHLDVNCNSDDIPKYEEPPEFFYIDTSAKEDSEFPNCTDRWTINPGESVPIIVKFKGQKVGTYQDKLTFSIKGYTADVFTLPVKASISLPEIDRNISTLLGPSILKPNLKAQQIYVESLKSYFFGYNVIGKEKTLKSQASKMTKEIKLVNTSVFPVIITAILEDVQHKNVWGIDQQTVKILPNQEGKISISFNPVVAGKHQNTLILFIKDNPEPIYLSFLGEVCIPTLKFSTDSINMGKIITNQTATNEFLIENEGIVPAYWRIKGGNTLGQLFTIEPLEGIIKPRRKQAVTISFSSKKQIVFKKSFQIEVMDQGKMRTFETFSISVLSEAFDVNFNIEYENNENSLNFGVMTVGEKKTQSLTMKTHGKYPLMFRFKYSNKYANRLFNIFPLNGGVQPNDKGTVVQFTYSSNRQTNYKNSEGIIVDISDSLTGSQIASVPILFNAKTLFSHFEISPAGGFDVGLISAGIQTTREIIIKNTGMFDFSYAIETLNIGKSAHPTSKVSTRSQKGPSPRRSSVVKTIYTVTSGFVTLSTSSLTVAPNESTSIRVDINPKNEDRISEIFIFKISNSSPEVSDGVRYNVSGTPIYPSLSTDDYEQVFKDINICTMSDAIISNKNSYAYDKKVIYFAPSLVNSKSSVTVNLYNKQLINADVLMSVKCNSKDAKSWIIEPESFTLEPNSSMPVKLTFNPSEVGTYKARLNATIKSSTYVYQCNIEALCSVPAIDVKIISEDQDAEGEEKCSELCFSKLLVNTRKEKKVLIENKSPIPIRIGINGSPSSDFILPTIDNSDAVTIDPKRDYTVPVIFCPQKSRKCEFKLMIKVLDNPDSSKIIKFDGEGYCNSIYLECNSAGRSNLNFDDTIVGIINKIEFKIHNISHDYYRFQFAQNANFTFSPRIGHIHPESTKNITCKFFSDKQIHLSNVRVPCTLSKIYIHPNVLDWDDTHGTYVYMKKSQLNPQKVTIQMPSAELPKRGRKYSMRTLTVPEIEPVEKKEPQDTVVKVYQVDPEPPYTVAKEKIKDLVLSISATADTVDCHISNSRFEFPTTMMFEKRYHNFTLSNSSKIAIKYNWRITHLESVISSFPSKNHNPFSIEPVSGSIKPNKTMEFKAIFSPITDGDFSAKAICDIHGLIDSPSIQLQAVSKRPVIHINMEQSDYLTANRRQPKFNEKIPNNTRVVEIISPEKGKLAKKMIEMINTTDTPYDIHWTCKYDHSDGAIKCRVTHAFISSGRSFFSPFEFIPQEVRTVEALWSFSIPSHSITADILIVGRVYRL